MDLFRQIFIPCSYYNLSPFTQMLPSIIWWNFHLSHLGMGRLEVIRLITQIPLYVCDLSFILWSINHFLRGTATHIHLKINISITHTHTHTHPTHSFLDYLFEWYLLQSSIWGGLTFLPYFVFLSTHVGFLSIHSYFFNFFEQ